MKCANKTPDACNGAEFTNRKTMAKNTLFRKEGQSNIVYKSIQSKRLRYIKDIYITLLDIKWRWALLIVFAGFAVSTLIFSAVYYSTSYIHGDFDHLDDPNHAHCFTGVRNYWDLLLFSVETQSTIGYGAMYPNTQCGITIPVVFVQVTLGFILETMLLGFIFMKAARPKHRRHTLIFSDKACVCLEDKFLNLQIRVGDIRNTHLIDTHLHGILVKQHVTAEKFVYPLYQHELKFTAHGMRNKLFLFYPLVVSHKITPDSPLHDLTPEGLLKENFELLVILHGTIESTGEMVQAMTSFSSKDIRWGCRFAGTEEYDDVTDKWCINFNNFNLMVPAEIPRCSATDLTEKISLPLEADTTGRFTAM